MIVSQRQLCRLHDRMRDEARHGSHQLEGGPQQALHAHPAHHHEGRERAEQPMAGGPREACEAEEVVVSASGKDAAVRAAAVQDAASARGLLGLDQRRVSRPREVDVHSPLPVVVMESWDVGAHAVHHRHLEGRRRGRQADRHRLQVVAVTPQQSLEEGHAPRRQSPLKDDARQAVNLHDQEPPVRADGGGTTAKTADETIDPTLEGEDQVVQGHRHCRS